VVVHGAGGHLCTVHAQTCSTASPCPQYVIIPNQIEDAAYLTAFVDSNGDPLSGANGAQYQVTFNVSQLPIRSTGW
jgi:hypothetical protein